MKIFIYGAGASKASQPHIPNLVQSLVAPLTNELFSPIYESFAAEVGLTPDKLNRYRQALESSESLETWLTDWWSKAQAIEDKNLQQAHLSQFGRITIYIWYLLYRVSNYSNYDPTNKYSVLIKKLYDKGESFGSISFNYDTLLDKALDREYGAELHQSLDNYIAYRLIKPHGSVNWFFPSNITPSPSHDAIPIDAVSKAMFKSPANLTGMRVFSPFFQLNTGYFNNYQSPLLLMPLTTKLYPHFNEFYQKMVRAGREFLSQAREVYLIGYRAHDDIIKDLFQSVRQGTKVHVVSNHSAHEIMKYVMTLNDRLDEGEAINGGFAEFCDGY